MLPPISVQKFLPLPVQLLNDIRGQQCYDTVQGIMG